MSQARQKQDNIRNTAVFVETPTCICINSRPGYSVNLSMHTTAASTASTRAPGTDVLQTPSSTPLPEGLELLPADPAAVSIGPSARPASFPAAAPQLRNCCCHHQYSHECCYHCCCRPCMLGCRRSAGGPRPTCHNNTQAPYCYGCCYL